MAIADDRQRVMPTEQERSKGQRLGFGEAVLITHSSDPQIRGEVPLFISSFFIPLSAFEMV